MQLLERDTFVAELKRAVQEAANGNGSTALISGEAGIGKTSLIQRVLTETDAEMRTLLSGCEALFTPRPLGPLYDVASALGGDVDRLLSTDTGRERLFPAVLETLSSRPTIFVVEDIHWADRATLDLLKYVARRIARTPLLLVLTFRDDEIDVRHPLVRLLGDVPVNSIRRLRLPRLSETAVRALAVSRGRHSRELYDLTSGNPFFVTEVLEHEGDEIPPTVRDAVLARMSTLSPAARRVVEIASIAPRRIERWLIRAVIEGAGDHHANPSRIVDGSDDSIEEALASGVLQSQDDALLFRHELARRAVEDSLPPFRRGALHASLLALLRQREDVAFARLAHHAEQSHNRLAILELAPRAAEAAIRADAHREAAAHYRSMLPHAEDLNDEARADLLGRLSYECYLTEQGEEAFARRFEALALWRSLGNRVKEGDTLRWLSRLSWFLGRNREAREYAAAAIDVLEPLPHGVELAMAWSNRAQLHMLAAEVEEAVLWGERAIALARELEDASILSHALNNVGAALARSDNERGMSLLEESLRIALERGFQEHAGRAWCNLATHAIATSEYERGAAYVDGGLSYCAEHDLDAWRIYVLAWRARMHLERGSWDAAADDAHAVLAHPGVTTISRIPALAVLGRVRSRRGDPAADAVLTEAAELASITGELQRMVPVVCARAEGAWLAGDLASLLPELRQTFAMTRGAAEAWERGELAYWLALGGVIDRAPADVAEPWRLQIDGDWRAAAAAWRNLGRPYEAALALSEGNEPEALRAAIEILDAIGSNVLAPQLRARLRLRGPRETTRRNPFGLTAREVEIVELINDGLRNAEIADRLSVSAKTVDHHVSAVLAKLGARSRSEAARLYRQDRERATER